MIDLRRLLRLDEPRLLAQQVRLVIDNIRGTTWVGLLMVVLVRLAPLQSPHIPANRPG